MNSKRIIFVTLLLLILSIGAVSAANETDTLSDNDDKAIMGDKEYTLSISEDEVLSAEKDFSGATFSELNNTLSDESYNVINLKNNITQDTASPIKIGRSITINGNGHTIDARNKSGIFYIASNNVVLNNIIFINGNANSSFGGAIGVDNDKYVFTAVNCTFNNNTSPRGGAIYHGNAINCTFNNNTSPEGGAIYHGNAINCTFTANSGAFGGAAFQSNVVNCIFNNNSGNNYPVSRGGAILDSNAINCTFNNNTAMRGGAVCNVTAINCTFNNNTAMRGGAISDGNAINCTFTNNQAEFGGAVYQSNATDCTFTNNTAADSGGAIKLVWKNNAISNCTFTNNTAPKGGAISLASQCCNTNITYCKFIRNNAETGAAIECGAEENNGADNTFICNCTFSDNVGKNAILYNEGDNTYIMDCSFLQSNVFENEGIVYWGDVYGFMRNTTFTYILHNYTNIYGHPEKIITDDGDFKSLQKIINYSPSNEITLLRDYVFNNSSDTGAVTINKNIKIIGNGYTIDAGKNAGIFKITANDVILTGLNLINGISNKGGAIYWYGDNGQITNSTFKMNAAEVGGAIYWCGNNATIKNTNFTKNHAGKNAGSIYFEGDNGKIIGCEFTGNNASKYAGSIQWTGNNGLITECQFTNNIITNGENEWDWNNDGGTENNSESTNNSTKGNGSSVYWNGTGVLDSLNFKDSVGNNNVIYIAEASNSITLRNSAFNTSGNYEIYNKGKLNLKNNTMVKFIYNAGNIMSETYITVLANSTEIIDINTALNLTATLKDDNNNIIIQANGLNFTINDENITSSVNSEGMYWALKTFDMKGKYLISTDSTSLSAVEIQTGIVIVKANPTINITGPESIKYNETAYFLIKLPDDARGEVLITIGGKNETFKLNDTFNGTIKYKIPAVNAGNYTVGAIYSGDEYYYKTSDSKDLKVTKRDAEFTITKADPVTYNQTVTITVNSEISEKFNTTIYDQKGNEVTAKIQYDADKIIINGLDAGNYTVNITSIPTDPANYNGITKNTEVSVNKADADFNITEAQSAVYDDDAVIGVETREINGEFKVNVYDDKGGNVSAEVNCGKDKITVAGLKIGNYTVNITYVAYDTVNYNNVTKSVNITVESPVKNLTVEIPEIIAGKQTKISVTLPKDTEGNLTLIIDGTTIDISNFTNGTATVTVPANLTAGNHTVEVSVDTNLGSKTQTQNLTVAKAIITADNMTRAYNSGCDFQATLLTRTGIPIAGETLIFTVNGAQYAAKTDAKGIATLNAKLDVGTYSVVVSNNLNSDNVTANAKIVARLTGNDLNMYYLDGSQLAMRVYGDDGKIAGAGEQVVIKIAGKTYTVKTDKNGYAKLTITAKLNKNTKKVTYTATAIYKGFALKNTVKINPILKYKTQKIKKSKKTNKIKVSLKKALKGKTIKLKIKGKTLKAKTNKKGVATFKIPKKVVKKLKAGKKYKIKIKYGKSKLTKKLKVKK